MRFVLWALPSGSTDRLDEQPLTSRSITAAEADRIERLAAAEGWHSFRRMPDDGSAPDFVLAMAKLASACSK